MQIHFSFHGIYLIEWPSRRPLARAPKVLRDLMPGYLSCLGSSSYCTMGKQPCPGKSHSSACFWPHHSIRLNYLLCLHPGDNHTPPQGCGASSIFSKKTFPISIPQIIDHSFHCDVSASSKHFHYSNYYLTVSNFLKLNACLPYHAISSLGAGTEF